VSDKQYLTLEVCAVDRAPVRLDATEVAIPGALGIFTVLPGHARLLATLGTGIMNVTQPDNSVRAVAIHGGVAQVALDHILILAGTAELDSTIRRPFIEIAGNAPSCPDPGFPKPLTPPIRQISSPYALDSRFHALILPPRPLMRHDHLSRTKFNSYHP
jgi:F0F1-type ATP synthase epsilon subunit